MAKRKNSVALFEVIHSDKRFGKKAPAAQPLRTPLWWFKNKTKEQPAAEAEAQVEAVEIKAKATKIEAPAPASDPEPIKNVKKEKVREKKISPMAFLKAKMSAPKAPPPEPDNFEPEAVFAPDHSDFKYSDPDPEPEPERLPSRTIPAMKAVDLAVDPDRQTISFKLTYTTALVGGFAVLIIVVLAFVIGQHLTHKPTPALTAMSTEDLRALPAHEDVINVDPSTPTNEPKPRATDVAAPPKPNGIKVAGTNEGPQPPKNFTALGERQVGLTYTVVQSYPDEHDAVKAKDILNQEGILCTVEQGIPGWGKWYVVVGVQGFARYRSDEYKAYVASIQTVSKKFAGNSKFKQFDPQPYTWRQAKP